MKDMITLIMALIVLSSITLMIIVLSPYTRDNEPTSDYVEFSDYQSTYKLHRDSQYRIEQITDLTGTYYFIYLWHGYNHMVVEYSDTVIDGQFTFAKHWKDSFILALKGEIE